MTVRVRFAPAPSGELHVGSARTTLFNWLFARHNGGTFVLRIEDTDPATARPEFIEPILDALRWLGLDWDEGPDVGGPYGPYRQSERRHFHEESLGKLVKGDFVYRCYCTREDIKARGVATGYDRHCRTLDQPDDGRPFALRFKVPEGQDVIFHDAIRGEIRVAYGEMQDFIVARSDGSPTFVLANTSDDIAMRITHAIRGTDLIAAAGQSTLIFKALGAEPVLYAHVPLILGPDKAKLSKRHMAVGMHAFRAGGYLPEAMVNYLALLGWSSPTLDEMLSLERLIAEFDLARVQHSPAVFDRQKLDWMNQEYIKGLEPDELERRIVELEPDMPRHVLRQAIDLELIQTRIVTLSEVPEAILYLHRWPTIDPEACEKVLGHPDATRTLEECAKRLEALDDWSVEAIKETIQSMVEELGLHKRKGPQPIRVAVSGTTVSLPLFESIWIIGREETVARLRAAAENSPRDG